MALIPYQSSKYFLTHVGKKAADKRKATFPFSLTYYGQEKALTD